MNDYSFPKEYHILKRYQFRYIQRKGAKGKSEAMRIFAVKNNGQTHGRIGLTVSKKVGNAVIRNRVKRLMREVLRHHKDLFDVENQDMLLIANPAAAGKSLEEMKINFLQAFARLKEQKKKLSKKAKISPKVKL